MEMFDLKKLNEIEGKQQYRIEVSNRFACSEDVDTSVEINGAWEAGVRRLLLSASVVPS
jgi:hypothetical protein